MENQKQLGEIRLDIHNHFRAVEALVDALESTIVTLTNENKELKKRIPLEAK